MRILLAAVWFCLFPLVQIQVVSLFVDFCFVLVMFVWSILFFRLGRWRARMRVVWDVLVRFCGLEIFLSVVFRLKPSFL